MAFIVKKIVLYQGNFFFGDFSCKNSNRIVNVESFFVNSNYKFVFKQKAIN